MPCVLTFCGVFFSLDTLRAGFCVGFCRGLSVALAFYHGAWVRVNSFESQVNSIGNGILAGVFHKTENSILTLTFALESANIYLKEGIFTASLLLCPQNGRNHKCKQNLTKKNGKKD